MFKVLVLGGTNQIGIELIRLLQNDPNVRNITIITRQSNYQILDVTILNLDITTYQGPALNFDVVFSLLDTTMTLPFLKKNIKCKRIIQLSSTSTISKINSKDHSERLYYKFLKKSDEKLIEFSKKNSISTTVFRTTLIYSILGKDRNISRIRKFIFNFGFFPLVGKGEGLRAPISSSSVAFILYSNLNNPKIDNQIFIIQGCSITYRKMINTIFNSLNKRPKYLIINHRFFEFIYGLLIKTGFSPLNFLHRMNQDLIFNDNKSKRKLINYKKEDFTLENDY